MTNKEFNYNDLYKMIRSYYLIYFPYGVEFKPSEVISFHLRNNDIKGMVIVTDSTYTFDNPSPTKATDDIYDEMFTDYRINVEKYLSDSDELKKVVRDLNQLKSWLIKEGFLRDGKPTLLMLQTATI